MGSKGLVSSQSFGSSAVSLACITSMCSVQRFPGGHCLHLAFGSFFYRLTLAVFAVRSSCFFLPCLWQRLAFVQSLFPHNLGRQSWRDTPLCVRPWFLLECFVCNLMVRKFDNSLAAVFSGDRVTVVLHSLA